MIHLVNGDSLGEKLRDCDEIEGEVFVWREMYDWGPLSQEWSTSEQLERRASFFEERIGLPQEQMLMMGRYQEQRLNMLPYSSHVVLWFEPDRCGQMLFLYLVSRLHRLGITQLEMVRGPYKNKVMDWGEATCEELQHWFRHRAPIDNKQQKQAVSALWAFQSANPQALIRWMEENPPLLPDVHTAFRTHLDYYPSVENGLNKVEELTLQLIHEGVTCFSDLFSQVSTLRLQDGLTDIHFAALLNELGESSKDLIQIDGAITGDEKSYLTLTTLGHEVLKGKEDRIHTVGIDWWLGGVHLTDGSWRRSPEDKIIRIVPGRIH